MANSNLSKFSSPIPGQSLATEPQARPWESPAKYSDPDSALEYYAKKLADPTVTAHMLQILESGYPIADLVDAMTLGGVLQGLHTIDVAVMISPVVFELIQTVAKETGIDYKAGANEESKPPTSALMQLALKEPLENEQMQISNEEELDRLNEAFQTQGLMERERDPDIREEQI